MALTSNEPLLFELAEKLWAPAPAAARCGAIAIEVVESALRGDFGIQKDEDFLEGARNDGAAASGSPRGAADHTFSFEERLRWVHEPAEFRCEVPGVLEVRIDLARARVDARIAALFASLSRNPSSPSSLIFPF